MKRSHMLATACLIGLAGAALAAGGQSAQSFSGHDEFRIFCASCHGDSGKGDGPVGSSLRKKPADLTQLSKKNNGEFPREAVYKMIDGRTPVTGHGGPDMPVWGNVFAQSRESAGAEGVKTRVNSLVSYLESIQDKR